MRLFVSLILLVCLFPSFVYSMTHKDIKEAYEKSYLYEKGRDYKDAIKALMPVYQSYPDGYTVNLRLGWLYYLMQKYANSEYHYGKALKAVPSSVEAMLGLSLPFMAQDRWNDVESLMYRVLKIDYYNYYGNLRLCIALRNLKKFSTSEAVARKMLSIYPTDVNFLNELAISLYYRDKKSYARTLFEDVLVLDPENTVAKNYLKVIESTK